MKLGIATDIFAHKLTEEDLSLIKNAGIHRIEIPGCTSKFWHFHHKDNEQVNLISQAARSLGIEIYSFHSPYYEVNGEGWDLSSFDNEKRNHALIQTKEVVDVMKIMGAKVMVLHLTTSKIPRDEGFKQRRRYEIETVRKLADYCREKDVKIALENSPGTTRYVLDFIDEVDSEQVGFCLDTSHAHCGKKIDVSEAVEIAKEKLLHIHASDNNGDRDAHALPYEGTIDWEKFVKTLQKVGYDGAFIYEVRASDTPEVDLKYLVETWQKWIRRC